MKALVLLALTSLLAFGDEPYSKQNPIRLRLSFSCKDDGSVLASETRVALRKFDDVLLVDDEPTICVDILVLRYPTRPVTTIAAYKVYQPFNTSWLPATTSPSVVSYCTNFINIIGEAVGVLPSESPGQTIAAWIDGDSLEKARMANQRGPRTKSKSDIFEWLDLQPPVTNYLPAPPLGFVLDATNAPKRLLSPKP